MHTGLQLPAGKSVKHGWTKNESELHLNLNPETVLVPLGWYLNFFVPLCSFVSPYVKMEGTSLAVQWLRISLLMEGLWVQSLVGELKQGKNKTYSGNSIVTNSMKTLKNGPYQNIKIKNK